MDLPKLIDKLPTERLPFRIVAMLLFAGMVFWTFAQGGFGLESLPIWAKILIQLVLLFVPLIALLAWLWGEKPDQQVIQVESIPQIDVKAHAGACRRHLDNAINELILALQRENVQLDKDNFRGNIFVPQNDEEGLYKLQIADGDDFHVRMTGSKEIQKALNFRPWEGGTGFAFGSKQSIVGDAKSFRLFDEGRRGNVENKVKWFVSSPIRVDEDVVLVANIDCDSYELPDPSLEPVDRRNIETLIITAVTEKFKDLAGELKDVQRSYIKIMKRLPNG